MGPSCSGGQQEPRDTNLCAQRDGNWCWRSLSCAGCSWLSFESRALISPAAFIQPLQQRQGGNWSHWGHGRGFGEMQPPLNTPEELFSTLLSASPSKCCSLGQDLLDAFPALSLCPVWLWQDPLPSTPRQQGLKSDTEIGRCFTTGVCVPPPP